MNQNGSSSFGAGIIDFHCHLGLYADLADALAKLEEAEAGVVVATSRASEHRALTALIDGEPHVAIGLGMHPEIAGSVYEATELEIFTEQAKRSRFISEIGLDGVMVSSTSPNFGSIASMEAQESLFKRILSALNESHVASVHSRAAEELVLDHLENSLLRRTIFHNFSGAQSSLARAVDLGSYFSVNPWMLEGKSGVDLVRNLPLNRILIETDGPFSTWDSRLSQPSDCLAIAYSIAEVRNDRAEDIVAAITANQVEILS